MPIISQAFIDRMKTADATRAVAERLLERDRRNGRFFCSLHNDPTVSDDGDVALYPDGNWYCHKGGHGGDVYGLVALADGLDLTRDFPECVQRVADLVGLPVEYDDGAVRGPQRGVQRNGRGRARGTTENRFGGDVRPPKDDPTPRPDLLLKLEDCIGDLPDSPGEEYLGVRGFALDLARMEAGRGPHIDRERWGAALRGRLQADQLRLHQAVPGGRSHLSDAAGRHQRMELHRSVE